MIRFATKAVKDRFWSDQRVCEDRIDELPLTAANIWRSRSRLVSQVHCPRGPDWRRHLDDVAVQLDEDSAEVARDSERSTLASSAWIKLLMLVCTQKRLLIAIATNNPQAISDGLVLRGILPLEFLFSSQPRFSWHILAVK